MVLGPVFLAYAVVALGMGTEVRTVAELCKTDSRGLRDSMKKTGMEVPSFYKKSGMKMLKDIAVTSDQAVKMAKYRLPPNVFAYITVLMSKKEL